MLTPEDKNTLIEFAGPLFAMSKEIDGMYFNDARPKTDGMPDSGIARGIQEALERDFRLSQAPRRTEPVYVPQVPQPIAQYPPQIEYQAPVQQVEHIPQSNSDQYEFNFNPSKQDITNTLLESQNRLIKELTNKVDNVISLLTNDKIKGKQN